MKRYLLIGIGIIISILINTEIPGQTIIASWSFDGLVAPTASVPTISVINAEDGVLSANATVYLDGTNGSSTWISVPTNPELTTFSGSTLNDPRTTPVAGNALVMANSSANGKYVIIKFSTTGYSNIVVTFATRGTATGFDTHTWDWSTDNSVYTSIGSTPANKTSTWSVETVNLSAISAINNVTDVYLRLTLTGATSAAGNNRIDNLVIYSDTQAPVPAFNPANSATDVAVNLIPTITFDEPVYKTDGSEITDADLLSLVTFKKTDSGGENVSFTATIDASKKIITVTPSSTLLNSQIYYLGIGPVEDIGGNTLNTGSTTFTTIAAATPTISVLIPNGGEKYYSGDKATITWETTNFEVGDSVKIEVKVPDEPEWVWITLVASTENDGSEEVNVGPDADYGTQYLIRISGVTNLASDESDNPFTVIATAGTLLDLRSYPVGAVVKYKGVATVTYARTSYNQKYIQDATAAILIHDPTPAPGYISGTYNIGDGITNVEGLITLYNGLLEIVPQSVTGEAATGTTITPEVRSLSGLTSNDQCKLVKIEKLQFANPTQYDAGGLFISGENYDLTGFTPADFAYRTAFSEADYINTAQHPVPAQLFDVVALVGQYNTKMQITARFWADFTLLSSAKAITSFVFEGLEPDVTGAIDENGKTVALTVPNGTNITALVPTITLSDKATVSPLSGVAADFTSPVIYTVTAEDGTTQSYTATVSFVSGIENASFMNMKIFPVPAGDMLRVRNISNVRNVEILDATGRLIRSSNLTNDTEINIPVGDLKQGIYFLRLTTPNGKVIRRFVK